METIRFYLALGGAFFALVGIALMLIASVISLFKIDEADKYYGVGKLDSGKSVFKGLPFSLTRMTWYGMTILFSRTPYVQKRFSNELAQIMENNPPHNLERLLVWLYAPWFLSVNICFVLGGLMMLLPETT